MSADQLGDLGRGTAYRMSIVPAPVNVGKPASDVSGVGVAAQPDSVIGPKVVVVVTGKLPGEDARCYSAHITATQATDLAAELLMAASIIIEHEARRS